MLPTYLHISLSSAAVYLFIVIAIRLFGKKELAQLSVVDLVFILLISNSVQNAMVGENTSLSGGLIAAGSLFVVNFFFKSALYRFPRLGKWIQGEPVVLVYAGRIYRDNLARTQITEAELLEVIREHGVGSVSEINLAMLEVDGNISVLSNEFKHRTRRQRRAHTSPSDIRPKT